VQPTLLIMVWHLRGHASAGGLGWLGTGGGGAIATSAGGRSYNIWAGQHPAWDTISYEMPAGTTSVSNLDIGALAQDAVSRGYLSPSCYLISVEAGSGLWHGGAGLATHSFPSASAHGSDVRARPAGTPGMPLITSQAQVAPLVLAAPGDTTGS